MRVVARVGLVVLFAICLIPAAGRAQVIDACTPTPSTPTLTIDARSGDVQGPTRFKRSDQLRVVVENKNPYLFEYRLTLEAAPVPGPSTGDFLALFGLKFETVDPEAVKKAAEKTTKAAAGAPSCPSAGALSDGNDRLVQALRTATDEWKKVEAPLENASKAGEKATKVFNDANAVCSTLLSASTELLATLSKFEFKPGDVQKAIALLNAETIIQERLIADVAAKSGSACRDELDLARLSAAGAKAEGEKLTRNVTTAQDAAKSLTTTKTTVQTVLATPGAFVETRWTGDFDEPTNVTAKLERRVRKPEATFTEVGSRRLNFGGRALFAVSGGWSIGWVRRLEYAARDGQPRNEAGEPIGDPAKAVPIAEEVENSMPRGGLALLGHVRVADLSKGGLSGVHATLGLTPRTDNDGPIAEVFFGPSLSFANELFFVSFTAYRAWQQTLEASYYPGKALPEGTSTVPTGSDEKWGFGISVSLRLR